MNERHKPHANVTAEVEVRNEWNSVATARVTFTIDMPVSHPDLTACAAKMVMSALYGKVDHIASERLLQAAAEYARAVREGREQAP